MQRATMVLMALTACATSPIEHADCFMLPYDHLERPKKLVITRASDEDAAAFAAQMRARGFDVVQPIAGVLVEKARYAATIEGVCGYGWSTPTLHIDVFDLQANRQLFESKITNIKGCPGTFFADVATKLDAWWDR